ncbi:hypothetical protein [Oceanobacillus kimchii]|uniref:Uncharacterized protein n=1 Tax=Oceanobacillus kimchii TaxID=746691 RepID=A0ABQ5TM12_9BACI|nr:hypothetical protein [Oceanobacillus kimchii]GLO66145.1 hypothetical protein MACH08_19290 [Oceanobacillus kimchii]
MGKIIIKEDEKQCIKCLKVKKKSAGFFNSYDSWHTDGKMPYCKQCLKDVFDEKNIATIKEILYKVDKPFNYELYNKAFKDEKETLGKYFVLINFNNKHDKYADSVFDYGDEQGFREDSDGNVSIGYMPEDIEEIEFTKEEMEYLIDFWGQGYSKDDYEYLQREYEKLTSAYESDSSYAMEILFQEAAQQRLTIKKKREKNEPVDKELKTFQELLGSANIKPSQETGANSAEQATFGTLIKKYENEKPIPEPDESWKDVDGIKKYTSVWFLGHLCKMLGIKNEYSDMYDEEVKKYTVKPPIGNLEDD